MSGGINLIGASSGISEGAESGDSLFDQLLEQVSGGADSANDTQGTGDYNKDLETAQEQAERDGLEPGTDEYYEAVQENMEEMGYDEALSGDQINDMVTGMMLKDVTDVDNAILGEAKASLAAAMVKSSDVAAKLEDMYK